MSKNLCEFDWPKEPQPTYTCKKCGQVITHEQVREFKKMNAVLFCIKKEEV